MSLMLVTPSRRFYYEQSPGSLYSPDVSFIFLTSPHPSHAYTHPRYLILPETSNGNIFLLLLVFTPLLSANRLAIDAQAGCQVGIHGVAVESQENLYVGSCVAPHIDLSSGCRRPVGGRGDAGVL